jgi:hypothetical protein
LAETAYLAIEAYSVGGAGSFVIVLYTIGDGGLTNTLITTLGFDMEEWILGFLGVLP